MKSHLPHTHVDTAFHSLEGNVDGARGQYISIMVEDKGIGNLN